jgi:hypothetical protein
VLDFLKNKDPTYNKIISKIIIIETQVEENIEIHFDLVPNLANYNALRLKIIEIINQKFIQPVIDRGLKKEQHKMLFQNNRSEFKSYIEQKLRYWLTDLINEATFSQVFLEYNNSLFLEIENNTKMVMTTADEDKKNLLFKTINDHILFSNKTILTEKITEEILSNNELKEEILEFFNEFLKYLVIF